MYTVLGNGYVFAVGAVSLVCCAAEAPANQHSSERSVRHKQHKNKHPQHPQRVFFAVAAGVFFCCSPHQQPKKSSRTDGKTRSLKKPAQPERRKQKNPQQQQQNAATATKRTKHTYRNAKQLAKERAQTRISITRTLHARTHATTAGSLHHLPAGREALEFSTDLTDCDCRVFSDPKVL